MSEHESIQDDQVLNRAAAAEQPWLKAQGSKYFLDWLAEQQISLALTTYQTGKLFLLGRKPDNAISIFERTFKHCMGMCVADQGRTLWLSSRYQIWRLNQAPVSLTPHQPVADDPESQLPTWAGRGYDFLYLPQIGVSEYG